MGKNARVFMRIGEGIGDIELRINGEDVTNQIEGFMLRAAAGQQPELTLDYHCFTTTVHGEGMKVRHLCPIEGEVDKDAG